MSYFKPFRRKLGVVTLLLACLFMAGWVRSLIFLDSLSHHSSRRDFRALSLDGELRFTRTTQRPENTVEFDKNRSKGWSLLSEDNAPPDRKDAFRKLGDNTVWSNSFLGLGLGSIHFAGNAWNRVYLVIPYWSLVLPLTLLSAYLLLSKPRRKPIPAQQQNSP